MKYLARRALTSLVFFNLLLFSLLSHAEDNTEVKAWVKRVLTETLSVSYNTQKSDFTEISKNYTFNAWNAMTDFLGGYMKNIRAKQLTVNPVFDGDPRVVKSGIYSGIHYWRVNQNVSFQEFNLYLSFSLIVLARDPSTGASYIIQSMDISKKTN